MEESPTLSKGLQNPGVNGIKLMMPGVQSKTIKYIDRQENITHNQEKQSLDPEIKELIELADKNIKTASIISKSKNVEKNMNMVR